MKIQCIRFFMMTSWKTNAFRVTGECDGHPPVAFGFPWFETPASYCDVTVMLYFISERTTASKVKYVLWTCILKPAILIGLIYMFICSLDFLSSAFRLLGGKLGGRFNTMNQRKNIRHFADNIFKLFFLYEKCCILIQISLFPAI